MQRNRSFVVNNLYWFLGSLALAFMVWLLATNEADPVAQSQFSIPVTYETDDDVIVTNNRNVIVTVRARQSVINVLTDEDVTVIADLTGQGPGTHTINLRVNVARTASAADTQPAQLAVTLEEILRQLKDVTLVTAADPPTGFEVDQVTFDPAQVRVEGVATRVRDVVSVEARLDLSERRESFDEAVELVPVNANGTRVAGVEVTQAVTASVIISEREDERQIVIVPDFDFTSGPDGYNAIPGDYSPQTITVRGERVNELPNPLETETIDLSGRTETFTEQVRVVLPEDLADVVEIVGNPIISVTVEIIAVEGSDNFEDIPVQVVGLSTDFSANELSDINVTITGPIAILNDLNADDIIASVDVTGLTPGTYDRTINVTVSAPNADQLEIQALPETLSVTITGSAVGTGTPAPTPTP